MPNDSPDTPMSLTGVEPLVPVHNPELVFGIVGPVGTDRGEIYDLLQNELHNYGYETHRIRVSQLINGLPNIDVPDNSSEENEYERIKAYMGAGTKVREITERGDVLALLCVAEIRSVRATQNDHTTKSHKTTFQPDDLWLERTAYILDSIKHPSEIEALRAIYGRAFVLVSVYTPRATRLKNLSSRIATSKAMAGQASQCLPDAEELIKIDESEGLELGQNVRNAFPRGDLFLGSSALT